MKAKFEVNKSTNVAYLDTAETAPDAVIRVLNVSEDMGLRCQVLARIDIKNKVFLGLVIEDYKAFRKEIRLKYLAWRIERITELLLCKVQGIVSQQTADEQRLAHI